MILRKILLLHVKQIAFLFSGEKKEAAWMKMNSSLWSQGFAMK